MTLRRSLPLFALALVLALTGCRDSLVDEPPEVADEPEQTEEASPLDNTMYLKGAGKLAPDETRPFRAENLDAAVRYAWFVSDLSTGTVSAIPTDERRRLYDITGEQPGVVILQVTAYDGSNVSIGYAEKRVVIER